MRTTKSRAWAWALLLVGVGAAWGGAAGQGQPAQEPSAPAAVEPEQLQAAIDKLGDLDYATRMAAARTVRRTPDARRLQRCSAQWTSTRTGTCGTGPSCC